MTRAPTCYLVASVIFFLGAGIVLISSDSSVNTTLAAKAGEDGIPLSFSPQTIDLADVTANQSVAVDICITNSSKDLVSLEYAVASCGCTVTNFRRQKLAPHESYTFTTSINVGSRKGISKKALTMGYRRVGSSDVPRAINVPIKWSVVPDTAS